MPTIGKLAAASAVKIPTIRNCELIGLLPEAGRSAGNPQLYDKATKDRLAFIRHARELGFSLEAIHDLLSLTDKPDQSCAAADAIAPVQLADVKARIERLKALQGELERMVTQCAGGSIKDCRVIEVLGNHARCGAAHSDNRLPANFE